MKPKFVRFNDGVVEIYREKEKRSNFAAKENVRAIDDMDFICKLDYEQLSIRQQDIDFAEQSNFSLSLKVRTRYVKAIKCKFNAVIDGVLYSISYLDKTRTEMFLFLEAVRELDT